MGSLLMVKVGQISSLLVGQGVAQMHTEGTPAPHPHSLHPPGPRALSCCCKTWKERDLSGGLSGSCMPLRASWSGLGLRVPFKAFGVCSLTVADGAPGSI